TGDIAESREHNGTPLRVRARHGHGCSAGGAQALMDEMNDDAGPLGGMFREDAHGLRRGVRCSRTVTEPVGNHQDLTDTRQACSGPAVAMRLLAGLGQADGAPRWFGTILFGADSSTAKPR